MEGEAWPCTTAGASAVAGDRQRSEGKSGGKKRQCGWMAFSPSMKPEAKSSAKKRRGRCGRMNERSEGVNSFIATGKITQMV